ncbi:hypothetical protein D8B26_004094 [Coccidioides posadasii str. Silveira]|uniref:Uncharacterized protein n=3 Tax=Coccidioides posadasii TaxID=199306 RepID=E9DHR5_COCPS|nr:hypothetical protein CPC735_042370 [Coccidioides posadasii C735 delta SOWgp]EER25793.1 hypothetical protein CPC735_042370 [Coccidioides posadasii C735 delta SOWgp]EFW13997.1 conserved hypothetical protein [Coccidioides posadasii str. Silveira]KMM69471.1 hypothetical protein CPAG_05786 [Coccidioides posadasii RMSCC 3488]QVM09432.1 hypothetical protein D8B26_004094 [Coccidioides posadasii str. Silveira]|eukprot:XP_003067938.1 hypothetical protein CPC735_042370 [Coccidioides posadasii C735 delta SOWgp]
MKKTIPSDVWDSKKDEISNLYEVEEWPLKQVMKKIRSESFDPTETQLRSRLKKWGVKKLSRQKRKKTSNKATESKVVKVEQSQEVVGKLTPCLNREMHGSTGQENNEGWTYPQRPSQNYQLGNPVVLQSDEMQGTFSIPSNSIAMSGSTSTLHPMPHPPFSYDPSRDAFGHAFSVPCSIGNSSIGSGMVNPAAPSQPFNPSAHYAAGVSPHMQQHHGTAPHRTSPSLLTPNSRSYASPEQSQPAFSDDAYYQVANSAYIPSHGGQSSIHDQSTTIYPCFGEIAPCDTEDLDSEPGILVWKRPSAVSGPPDNFMGAARVSNRRPRFRKPKPDGKPPPSQNWDANQIYSHNTLISQAAHPPLVDQPVHSGTHFDGQHEYMLPTSSALDINQR